MVVGLFAECSLVSVVVKVIGDVFPELQQHEAHIKDVIKAEETSFGRTLGKVRINISESQYSLKIIFSYLRIYLSYIMTIY